MRPTVPSDCANHSAPSGPVVMPCGNKPGGLLKYLTLPPVVIRPTPPLLSVNQRRLSGPTVIPFDGPGLTICCSVYDPLVVIRPMAPLPSSVNHSAPSGPATMPSSDASPNVSG